MPVYQVYTLMVLAALFWSGAFVTGKLAVQEFPPVSLTFFRFLVATPLVFIILAYKNSEGLLPTRAQWRPLIILGIVGTFLYHALFFSCLKYTSAINSSLIGSALPMVTTLLAVIFIKERITVLRGLGVLLAFSGIMLVVTNGSWSVITNLQFNTGDLLMFAAVWSWAIYSILSRVFMDKYNLSPLKVTAYTFLVCTVVSIPFLLWEDSVAFLPHTTPGGWLAVVYMAVFASVLGYLFQLIAVQKIGASKTAIFVNLVPVFTIIESVSLLGETFSFFKFTCAGIIIAGVFLASRSEQVKEQTNSATICTQNPAK